MSDVLVPPNATAQERALDGATARMGAVPVPVRDVWDADNCRPDLLPWLAWAYSLDEWASDWTTEQQRAAIKRAVEVQRYKGTIGAVKEALDAIGFTARVQEWFNLTPAGTPYTFRVLLESGQVGVSQTGMQGVVDLVEKTKNLRSHLDRIDLIVVTPAGPQLAGCASVGSEITLQFHGAAFVINEQALVG